MGGPAIRTWVAPQFAKLVDGSVAHTLVDGPVAPHWWMAPFRVAAHRWMAPL